MIGTGVEFLGAGRDRCLSEQALRSCSQRLTGSWVQKGKFGVHGNALCALIPVSNQEYKGVSSRFPPAIRNKNKERYKMLSWCAIGDQSTTDVC